MATDTSPLLTIWVGDWSCAGGGSTTPPLYNHRLYVMGNDVAGVRVLPEVSEYPVDPPETRELESDFPEVFTACVVTPCTS